MKDPGIPETGHYGGRYQNGDRVRVKSTGDTAVFIAYREIPDSWLGSDRRRWLAFVEYPNGDRDMKPPNDLEPLERKK